jgi:hypothetical protein
MVISDGIFTFIVDIKWCKLDVISESQSGISGVLRYKKTYIC